MVQKGRQSTARSRGKGRNPSPKSKSNGNSTVSRVSATSDKLKWGPSPLFASLLDATNNEMSVMGLISDWQFDEVSPQSVNYRSVCLLNILLECSGLTASLISEDTELANCDVQEILRECQDALECRSSHLPAKSQFVPPLYIGTYADIEEAQDAATTAVVNAHRPLKSAGLGVYLGQIDQQMSKFPTKKHKSVLHLRRSFWLLWSLVPSILPWDTICLLQHILLGCSTSPIRSIRHATAIAVSAISTGLCRARKRHYENLRRMETVLSSEDDPRVISRLKAEKATTETHLERLKSTIVAFKGCLFGRLNKDVDELTRFEAMSGVMKLTLEFPDWLLFCSSTIVVWQTAVADETWYIRYSAIALMKLAAAQVPEAVKNLSDSDTHFVKALGDRWDVSEFIRDITTTLVGHIHDHDLAVALASAFAIEKIASLESEMGDSKAQMDDEVFQNLAMSMFTCTDPAVLHVIAGVIDSIVFEVPLSDSLRSSVETENLFKLNHLMMSSDVSMEDASANVDLTPPVLRKAALGIRSLVEFVAEFGVDNYIEVHKLVLGFWTRFPFLNHLSLWIKFLLWCDSPDGLSDWNLEDKDLGLWLQAPNNRSAFLVLLTGITSVHMKLFTCDVDSVTKGNSFLGRTEALAQIENPETQVDEQLDFRNGQVKPTSLYFSNLIRAIKDLPRVLDLLSAESRELQYGTCLACQLVKLLSGIEKYIATSTELTRQVVCATYMEAPAHLRSLFHCVSRFVETDVKLAVIQPSMSCLRFIGECTRMNSGLSVEQLENCLGVSMTNWEQERRQLSKLCESYWHEVLLRFYNDWERVRMAEDLVKDSTKELEVIRNTKEVMIIRLHSLLSCTDISLMENDAALHFLDDVDSSLKNLMADITASSCSMMVIYDAYHLRLCVFSIESEFLAFCHKLAFFNQVPVIAPTLCRLVVEDCPGVSAASLVPEIDSLQSLINVTYECRDMLVESCIGLLETFQSFFKSLRGKDFLALSRQASSTELMSTGLLVTCTTYFATLLLATISLECVSPQLPRMRRLCSVVAGKLAEKAPDDNAVVIDKLKRINRTVETRQCEAYLSSKSLNCLANLFDVFDSILSLLPPESFAIADLVKSSFASAGALDVWAGIYHMEGGCMFTPVDLIRYSESSRLFRNFEAHTRVSLHNLTVYGCCWLIAALARCPFLQFWECETGNSILSNCDSSYAPIASLCRDCVRFGFNCTYEWRRMLNQKLRGEPPSDGPTPEYLEELYKETLPTPYTLGATLRVLKHNFLAKGVTAVRKSRLINIIKECLVWDKSGFDLRLLKDFIIECAQLNCGYRQSENSCDGRSLSFLEIAGLLLPSHKFVEEFDPLEVTAAAVAIDREYNRLIREYGIDVCDDAEFIRMCRITFKRMTIAKPASASPKSMRRSTNKQSSRRHSSSSHRSSDDSSC